MASDFSLSDHICASLSPLATCLPSCRLVRSPSQESLDNNNNGDASNRAWYEQSRPHHPPQPQRDSSAAHLASREADLLSLHEGVGALPVRRRFGRGGDISGGGGEMGSGLSRITLLRTLWRSWWNKEGAVRLEDSDDEVEDEGVPPTRRFSFEGDEDELDADAQPVPLDGNGVVPPPPLSVATTMPDRDRPSESKEERRERRRARRRARELGITVEEYSNGNAVEPDELLSPSLGVPVAAAGRRSKSVASSGSGSGSASTRADFILVDTRPPEVKNGSHGFTFSHQAPSLPSPSSLAEDELFGGGAPPHPRTKTSHSSASGSSHSRSRSSQYSPRLAPSSPATSAASTLSPTLALHHPSSSSKPKGHRSQQPSLSSTSTSSTSCKDRKKKRGQPLLDTQNHVQVQDALGSPTLTENDGEGYYQDASGQLQPIPTSAAGQWYIDDQGQQYFVPSPLPSSPSVLEYAPQMGEPSKYDHIGSLPTILAGSGSEGEEEREEITKGSLNAVGGETESGIVAH